jgi:hypothetical protein
VRRRDSTISSPQAGEGFDEMQDENGWTAKRYGNRLRSHVWAAMLGLLAVAATLVTPAAAQRPDDSYNGPSSGGGLDSQLRQFEPAPPPPAGGGGAGGGLGGGGSSFAGGFVVGRGLGGGFFVAVGFGTGAGVDFGVGVAAADVGGGVVGAAALFVPSECATQVAPGAGSGRSSVQPTVTSATTTTNAPAAAMADR